MLEKVLFSAALGGLVGIEREFVRREKKSIPMGARTLIFIAVLGCLTVSLGELVNTEFLVGIGFLSVLVLSGLNYYVKSKDFKELGLTTYGAGFITYFIGVFVGLNEFLIAVIIAVITTLVLSLSKELHSLAEILTREELKSAIIFAIIAFIVLPLLPNKVIDPFGLFNPFTFWLIVVIMSALSFTSYILLRLTKHGLSITGFLGGFISSKTTIFELSSTHKELNNEVINASLLAISAAMVSDIILFLIVTNDIYLFIKILIPIIITISVTLLLFIKKNGNELIELKLKNPFTLKNSLKNALIIFGFTQAIYVINKFINPSIAFISVVLGAMASGSAAIISTGTLYALKEINNETMFIYAIIIALVSILDKFIIIKISRNNELLKKITKPLILTATLLLTLFITSYYLL